MRSKFDENQDMHRSTCNLHYSKLLSVPVLGSWFYRLQIFLVQYDVLHVCWVSAKEQPLRAQLFKELKQNAAALFCSAWQLGPQLQPLKNSFALRYTGPSPETLPLSQLYNLEWALFLAQSVTVESVSRLGALLPKSYPVWNTYVLSVHQPLDVQCDFVKQTLRELLKREATVVLFSHVRQPNTAVREFRSDPHFIEMTSTPPQFFSSLPYWLRVRLTLGWEWLIKRQFHVLKKSFGSLLLWCFDPDDVQIIEFLPTDTRMLFDCVDYYTSLDPSLKKRIEKEQEQLIRRSNLFFVNSKTLHRLHKKEKSKLTLVPQGFDQEAFSSTTKLLRSGRVSKFFHKLRAVRKSYAATVSYVGSLSYRVDYPNLITLIQKSPEYLFCLPETVLPWPTEDTKANWEQYLDQLKSLPNVIWFPRLNRSEVRVLIKNSQVGLIPYDAKYQFNRYCFPMKLFEYFSVGVPVLSLPIEELKHYQSFVAIGKNAAELRQKLKKILSHEVSETEKQEMQRLCTDHTWEKKVTAILREIMALRRRAHQAE